MPSKPQGDLIREQGEEIVKLVERLDHLQRDFDRVEKFSIDIGKVTQEVEKRLAVAINDVDRLEKKLDEVSSRRWELWKIVLAAFLGAVLSMAGAIALKAIEPSHQTKQSKP